MAIPFLSGDVDRMPRPAASFILGLSLFAVAKTSEIAGGYLAGFGDGVNNGHEGVVHLGIHLLILSCVLMAARWCRFVQIGWSPHVRPGDWLSILGWWLLTAALGMPGIASAATAGRYFVYPDYLEFYLSYLVLFSVVLPITEEVVFRGILFAGLRPRHRSGAYVASGVLFLAWHLSYRQLVLQGSLDLQIWQTVVITVAGFAYTRLYERSGNLTVPVLCHAAHNLTLGLAPPIGYLLGIGKS